MYVNFLNKWFSWATIFMSKKKLSEKENYLKLHVHNGVNIEESDNMS